MNQTKKCKGCQQIKPLDDFVNDKKAAGGKTSKCKTCRNEYTKIYKGEHTEEVSEYNKKYREENKEKVQSYYKKSDEQKEANRKIKQEQYFNEFKTIIEQNGGTCLGTADDYKNAQEPILVKCGDGHEWKISLNNAQNNRWCPTCKTYVGELISMLVCKYIFDKEFKKVRPNWLKNSNGNNLELDIYNEELKLAVEYNGIQHYQFIPFFHETEEIFQKRVVDDKLKIVKCKENNIHLIIVPYTVPFDKICEYISEKAKRFKIDSIRKPKDFDYGALRSTVSLTEKVKQLIEAKGGKLLEGVCSDKKSRIVIECDENPEHVWPTTVKNIQGGSWCPECAHIRTEETKTKISTTLTNFLQTEKGKENKKKSHEKRSETMEKQKEEVRAEITEKKCNHCQETKKKEEFGIKQDAKDGLQTNCKKCVLKIKAEWRQKQKQQVAIGGAAKYKCDDCDKSFELKDSLTRHKKEKHSKPVSLSKNNS